jgi:hypothetical protein
VEEGEVVVGLALAPRRDPSSCFQPGVRALDGPAVTCERVGSFEPSLLAAPDLACRRAGGDRLARAARLADARLDLALAQGLLDRARGIGAVGPELTRVDAALGEGIEQREQVALLVLVSGREPDRERRPARVYGQVVAAARPPTERARDLLAPFFASTREASTSTRDQSSSCASTRCSCRTPIAAGKSPRRDHSSSLRRHVSPLGKASSR